VSVRPLRLRAKLHELEEEKSNMSQAPLTDALRTILGDNLEKILATRLNRMVELEALITLYQEFGEEPVRRVIENALTTYRDRAGRLRHHEKVSAIEKLEWERRHLRQKLDYERYCRDNAK
jgi:hypothetical protein